MKTMRLFEPSLVENAPLALVDLPIPKPGRGQVRIKICVCGACHTDLHTVEGDIQSTKMPITPGHQVVGVVDELGDQVDHLNVGDRIGIPYWRETQREF